jgi:argininosuccinate synthase
VTDPSTRFARSGEGRIVLAYPGGAASASALRQWLAAGREVVTVTIDVGRESDLDEVREQALSIGALRAHVLDAREEFARECLLPALRTQPLHTLDPHAIARPLIQRKLAEIAAIENATVVTDDTDLGTSPESRLHVGRTLIERPVTDLARLREMPAHIDLEIRALVPVAINGVPMAVGELLESLALIAGQHGVGRLPQIDAPAAPLLHAAYHALDGRDGIVRFELANGTLTTSAADGINPQLVNHT